MEKRKMCLLITVVGIFVIIFVQTLILIDDEHIEREKTYLEENLKIIAKRCVKDDKCNEDNITISKLDNENYLSEDFKKDLSEYSSDSYVQIPNYEVFLKDKET